MILLLLACSAPGPGFQAYQGDSLTLIQTDSPLRRGILELERAGSWEEVESRLEGDRFLLPGIPHGALLRLREGRRGRASVITPQILQLSIGGAEPAWLQPGEQRELRLDWEVPELLPSVPSRLRWLRFQGEGPIEGAEGRCLEACDAPRIVETGDMETLVRQPSVLPIEGAQRTLTEVVMLQWTLEGPEGGELLFMERSLGLVHWADVWIHGDLHGHSNLSYDGCEEVDQGCADRGEVPGEDYFAHAEARGLDFAALTDHSEFTEYRPRGPGGPIYDIWQHQLQLVEEAEERGVTMPLLGYEWTSFGVERDGHYSGGHRTVIFEQLDACSRLRIGAHHPAPYEKGDGGPLVSGVNPHTAHDVFSLWEELDAGRSVCGSGQVLTFAHHSAWDPPQPVDWDWSVNDPDLRYEMLIEVYSEHGSSECMELDRPGCGWRERDGGEHFPEGSVQNALTLGHRLGFVGGTDAHDGRPGSVEDEPSCTARWDVEGSPHCHPWSGGLTGVLVSEPRSRSALFSGLRDRRSYASSGPRPELRALASDPGGGAWLPGSWIEEDSGVWRLQASIPGADQIEVLSASGEQLAAVAGEELDQAIEVRGLSAVYLRARVGDERVWLSPWFRMD